MPNDEPEALNGELQPAPTESIETAEVETPSPVADEQGAPVDGADTSLSPSDESKQDFSPVPYDRFKEINDKWKGAEPKVTQYEETVGLLSEAVPGLRERMAAGVSLPEALRQLGAERDRQQGVEQAVSAEVTQRFKAIDDALADGQVSEDWARWAKQEVVDAAKARHTLADVQRSQAMSSAGATRESLLKEFPDADGDTIQDYILAGNPAAARSAAERTQRRIDAVRLEAENLKKTAIADYNAAQAKRGQTVSPERGNGKSAPNSSSLAKDISNMSDAEFTKWMAEQGRKTDLARA